METLWTKHKLSLIGVVLGALGGWLYWNYVGCASGHCMITSKPLNSTLYGAMLGFFTAGIFKKDE